MIYTIKITDQADNDDRTVSIMRVMYGGRDIDVQLDKYTKYEE